MTAEVFHEPLPGGMAWVTGGGTRTAIKLRRPWQQPFELLVEPDKCPFCNDRGKEEGIKFPGIPEGWRVLSNAFTPHRRHRLAIPSRCWPVDRLIWLGGVSGIRDALRIVRLAVAPDDAEMVGAAHIGWHAGQNVGHLHWHIHEALIQQPFSGYVPLEERVIREFPSAAIVADGVRSGECLILPITEGFEDELPEILFWLIELGAVKFRDVVSGLPPEFSVTVRFAPDGRIRYAAYCPVLTNWGALEYVSAQLEGCPFTLPWPHEVTAEYLRS